MSVVAKLACINMLHGFYKQVLDHGESLFDPNVEQLIDNIIYCWQTESWTDDLIKSVLRRSANLAFGDPMALSKDQLRLRQHSTQYYNPCQRPIVVEPMGLPDETGEIIKSVVPGGLIFIPQGYLIGGEKSTLHGVAPQLKPVPKVEVAGLCKLDLTPQSYVEWITYYPVTSSRCCRRLIVWSDKFQTLVCSSCLSQIKTLAC